MIEQRCQPEADRPFSIDRFAASSSRCIGCGSNSAAKASISSRVTRRGPNVPKRPGGKSSKVSVMMGIGASEARLWPLLAAISTRPTRMARALRASTALRCSSRSCPGQHSELGPVPSAQVKTQLIFDLPGERQMFEFRDLFQWDRFITPTIIKTFYWLVIALIALFGISGIFSGLAAMAISPFGGFIVLLSSIASVLVGIIFSRIAAEFILIVFRINEHLGAIRDQGQVH